MLFWKGEFQEKEENHDRVVSRFGGGCPLGWETEIFDIGMLKNSEVAWLSFAV